MEHQNVYPHPPWKRLYAELKNLLEPDRVLTYDELSVLMGLDVRTNAGRQQFYRCAKEVLLDVSFHLENIPKIGYRVVMAAEHVRCAGQQVKKGRRRIRQGIAIGTHVRFEELTTEQRRFQTDALARLSRLEQAASETLREVRKLAAASTMTRLPPGLGSGEKLDDDSDAVH
jgi:hypothetical protein